MSAPFDLAEFLPYRLAFLSERVSRRLAVDYGKSHGLSVAEWRVMVNLLHLGTASVRDIQVSTNLEKSRVSRAVTRLAAAGLVQKGPGQRDARLVEIALTDAGAKTLSDILPAARAVEAQLLAGLSAGQRQALFEAVEQLHRVLDADPHARPRPGSDAP